MADYCELVSNLPLQFFDDNDEIHSDQLEASVVDPRLLKDIDTTKFQLEKIPKRLRFVDDFWLQDDQKENYDPIASDSRFGKDVTTENELESFSKRFVPKNTNSNTAWALRNFECWCDWRSKAYAEDPVPADLLQANDPVALNRWLSLYLIETRRKDGKNFPSSTLDCLLSGLLRYTRNLNPNAVNFLDEKDAIFVGLRGVRDNMSRKLREEGVGASVKHTEAVSREEEEKLWSSGLLGIDSPRCLANAIFYGNGKNLCLRGGREHYNLKLSQFQFASEEVEGKMLECVVYTENGSKNRSGSYKDKAANKVVCHYAEPALKERCYVFLLKKYFSVLPKEVVEDPISLFYQQPKEETPKCPGVPWFKKQVRGRNTLQGMVKQICEKAGIHGKSNHSLRVTGASRMYECHVPEKLIKERTGHRSLDALRTYERASRAQQQTVSSVIASTDHVDFHGKAKAISGLQSYETATTTLDTVYKEEFKCSTNHQEVVQSGNAEHGTGVAFSMHSCSNCTFNITVGK